VLGILLLYFALIQWRSRPDPEDVVEVPKLLAGFDTLGTGKSLLVGFMLVAVNPKNLLLCMAGAAAIDLNTSTLVSQLGAYKVFTLIASSTVIFPMIPYLLARKRAAVIFKSWKDWLVRKNKVAMAVILLVLGIVLVYRGIEFAVV
jgi:threonine/homoserine/homoserine lactone efflux protein